MKEKDVTAHIETVYMQLVTPGILLDKEWNNIDEFPNQS